MPTAKQSQNDTTLNKGEASECYAVVHIMENPSVPLVDQNLSPRGDIKFLKIKWGKNTYDINNDGTVAITLPNNGVQSSVVKHEELARLSRNLLQEITNNKKIEKNCTAILDIKKTLQTQQVSTPSAKKSDFHAVVEFPSGLSQHEVGFSVKSYKGQDPSLINTNRYKSQFLYRILSQHGCPLNKKEHKTVSAVLAKQKNQGNRYKETIQDIYKLGFQLKFVKVTGVTLSQTLSMIDSYATNIIAEMLIEHYLWDEKSPATPSFADLVNKLVTKHKLLKSSEWGRSEEEIRDSLLYKVKNILIGYTSGATVSHKWNGEEKASGGVIIVDPDGSLSCLEYYLRNELGEYLIRHTYFDSPDDGKHPMGVMPNLNDEELYYGLQFHVRLSNKTH